VQRFTRHPSGVPWTWPTSLQDDLSRDDSIAESFACNDLETDGAITVNRRERRRRNRDEGDEIEDLQDAANWSSGTARLRAFQTGGPKLLRFRRLSRTGRIYALGFLILFALTFLGLALLELVRSGP
jgi:hypothetical protein